MRCNSVAITGVGLCTALGPTTSQTWDALLAGRYITEHSRAMGTYQAPRAMALAQRVGAAALAEARWNLREIKDAALIVGTSKGPMEAWIGDPAPIFFGLADVAAGLAGALGLGYGPRLTISTACASGLHALIRGAMLIEEGYRRVIVVAVESSLHPLFLGSFQNLGVLAAAGAGCRPFDEDRGGFIVSEAAAAICLQADGDGLRVERFAMGGDAVHLTRGSSSGQTLRRLLAEVMDGRGVDLVHAHGTGTIVNDPIELDAIESAVAGGQAPWLYSHKGALGHALGAAGLVAVVLNCLAHERGIIPPNPQTRRPLPMKRVRLGHEPVHGTVRRSVVVANGFGGAAAAVALTCRSAP